jgi:LysM repeat protein
MTQSMISRPNTDYTRAVLPLAAALALAWGLAIARPAQAEEAQIPTATGTTVQMAANAPERYVVVKGDTLWAISAKFLSDPWRWPDLWKVNPQITNPHLIYPGDEIALSYVEGQPQLTVRRGGETVATSGPTGAPTGERQVPANTVRLQPKIRTTPLDEAVTFLPLDAIRPFLSQSGIIDPDVAEKGPYIFATVDGRVMAGASDRVYVRQLPDDVTAHFTIVRMGQEYEDPDTGDTIGYQATYIGEGQIEKFGDPGVLLITSSKLESLHGDKLVTDNLSLPTESFQPRQPKVKIDGKIIDVVGGVSQIGQYQVVVMNKGTKDGLQPSDVLLVMQTKGTIRDRDGGFFTEKVELPDARAGEVLVFRCYERISFGLLMRAEKEIAVGDKVISP